jgi:thiosulfate/3-mercaptopyruvate sulfurtransferase
MWKSYGFETEKKVNVFPPAKHSLKENKEIYATYDEVEKAKSGQNNILVDSRERLNFLSEHIPGATNLPYTMLGTADSILRKPQEIKRFMENRGISTDDEVITYCGSVGTLSGLAYYALRMGGVKKIRLYSKSFKEWKKLGKPIEEFKDANFWDLSAE